MIEWKVLPVGVVVTAVGILMSVVADSSTPKVSSKHYYGQIESSEVYIATMMISMKIEVGFGVTMSVLRSSWFGFD